MLKIKSNVRKLMQERNETLRNLSKNCGLAHQTLFRATRDDCIGGVKLETLFILADALKVEVQDLFTRK